MKQDKKKSERELFEEEIKNWPLELEQEAEKSRQKNKLLNESITSDEEFNRYFDSCISWDEYKKKWLK